MPRTLTKLGIPWYTAHPVKIKQLFEDSTMNEDWLDAMDALMEGNYDEPYSWEDVEDALEEARVREDG